MAVYGYCWLLLNITDTSDLRSSSNYWLLLAAAGYHRMNSPQCTPRIARTNWIRSSRHLTNFLFCHDQLRFAFVVKDMMHILHCVNRILQRGPFRKWPRNSRDSWHSERLAEHGKESTIRSQFFSLNGSLRSPLLLFRVFDFRLVWVIHVPRPSAISSAPCLRLRPGCSGRRRGRVCR